ncbi:MAG: GatB/YqeY domain-containing protein [Chloroflexi bacterium]|nr:MAG: GatB/YqeY domain-containing protein [Chloroflexota bacterium]
MGLLDQINEDLKQALKNQDKLAAQTLRSLKSAIKYAEIEAGHPLDEAGVLAVIAKQAKQRRDSISEFQKGQRTDLVEQETAELAILERYLPAQLSEEEIRARAQAVITELGVADVKGMGAVMKRLMADLKGQADGKLVNQVVRQLLSK